MKSIKLLGLTLLAVFALGAFAAMSASAEEGFLPLTQKTGNALGGESVLATEKGESIVCEKLDESTITFTNDKHGEGTLHWLNCKLKNLGLAVNSLGDESKVILAKVLFLVCLDPKNAAKTLIDNFGVAAEIDTPVHLEVPAIGTLIEVDGTALGAILTTGPAKLWVMEFKGEKGKQTVTECLEGANVKKTHAHILNKPRNRRSGQRGSQRRLTAVQRRSQTRGLLIG